MAKTLPIEVHVAGIRQVAERLKALKVVAEAARGVSERERDIAGAVADLDPSLSARLGILEVALALLDKETGQEQSDE